MSTELKPNPRNRSYPNTVTGYPKEGLYTPTVDQNYHLGTRYQDIEGNVYYYAQASSAGALVAGQLVQSAAKGGATTTDQVALASAGSSAVGDKFGYATILTTAQLGGLFDDGYYCVESGGVAGQMYKIKNDDVEKDVAGALTVADHKFTFYEPVRATLTGATSIVRLMVNPYRNVIQNPVTTETGSCIGGNPMAVTASYYFWLQTHGIFNCASGGGGALVAGEDVLVGVVAGECFADDAATVNQRIGHAPVAVADNTFGPIFLQIRA